MAMLKISLGGGLMFLLAIAGQVIGASFLPATKGFTHPAYTVACVGGFVIALFCMARLIASGIDLSMVVPVMTCSVPLGILAVAFFYYGEPASISKVALLVMAVVLIGVASVLGPRT
jgi:multidrug transporter EmrE-like cation transporter